MADELFQTYGPTQYQDRLFCCLTKLQQTGSLRDYEAQFSRLLLHAGKLAPEQVSHANDRWTIRRASWGRLFHQAWLRLGYHQIHMNPDDVEKTAFQTHEDHHECLVIPFGQTTAPLTFQSLMNLAYKEYFLKFLLVYFDDLTYRKTMEE